MRRRHLIGLVAIAVVAVLYFWLGRAYLTRATFDSTAYLEAAAKPWSFDQFAYPKPMFVSLVYRVTGDDIDLIANVQRLLALLAWSSLGVVVVASFKDRRAQIAAGIVVALFALDPVRRGFADVILSESITDSLFALGLAAALLTCSLRGRRQLLAAGTCALLVCLWTLARDTNAIAVLVGAVGLMIVSRSRRVLLFLAAPVIVAIFALVSVNLVPEATTFTVQAGWPVDMTPRGKFAQLDNVVDRMLPDVDMPQRDEVIAQKQLPREPSRGGIPGDRAALVLDDHFAPARTWITSESRGAYIGWLVRHPVARIAELARNTFTLLGAGDQYFMPKGWKRYGKARFIDDLFGITTNRVTIVLVALAGLLAIWRRRQHPLRLVVLVAMTSGLAASIVAFYADSSETGRHCYGHGQQVLLGLYLAALLWLERE